MAFAFTANGWRRPFQASRHRTQGRPI